MAILDLWVTRTRSLKNRILQIVRPACGRSPLGARWMKGKKLLGLLMEKTLKRPLKLLREKTLREKPLKEKPLKKKPLKMKVT